MRKIGIIVLFAVFPISLIFSQSEDVGGIIYGDNWACVAMAPEGWIMDQESMAHYGIYALFYERGKKFGYPTPIIYINTTGLRDATDFALREFIESDLERNKKNGSDVTAVNKQFPNFTKKHQTAYFVYNIINSRGQYETIIYTRYKKTCFLVVLNAPNVETLNSLYPKIEEVVEKIGFMDKS
jgi:hypothetical protein